MTESNVQTALCVGFTVKHIYPNPLCRQPRVLLAQVKGWLAESEPIEDACVALHVSRLGDELVQLIERARVNHTLNNFGHYLHTGITDEKTVCRVMLHLSGDFEGFNMTTEKPSEGDYVIYVSLNKAELRR